MRDISFFAQGLAVLAITIAMYLDIFSNIHPKTKRYAMSSAAYVASTLFSSVSTVTLLIANNHEWTFNVVAYVLLRQRRVFSDAETIYLFRGDRIHG